MMGDKQQSQRAVRTLPPALLKRSLDVGKDKRPGRAMRGDGWTPDRIRTFLEALAECGCVADAAARAGMSVRSAYYLRNRAENGAFRYAWDAARLLARDQMAENLTSRALNGYVEIVTRDGKPWLERRRYDNRLSLAMLARLDHLAEAQGEEAEIARIVAGEFEEFAGIVASGGVDASEFIARRRKLHGERGSSRIAGLLERLLRFVRHGAGLEPPVDTSDLDAQYSASWTEEQCARARKVGILKKRGGQDRTQDPEEELVWRTDRAGHGWWYLKDDPPSDEKVT